MTANSDYKVIVVGAGFAGLPAAKNLQLKPSVTLLIIDANRSVGGVRTYKYPDFPMHEGFGVKKRELFPGEAVEEYFRQYADHLDLTRRILLETRVQTVEKTGEGRQLRVERMGADDRDQEGAQVFTCENLMVAIGLTSSPAPLDHVGSKNIEKPTTRCADLAQRGSELRGDPSIQHATILGSGKLAYDCVSWRVPRGRWVNDKFWNKLGPEIVELAGLNKHEKLKVLHPDGGSLWYGSAQGALNHPTNINDFVTTGQKEVQRTDVGRRQGKTLSDSPNGGRIKTDALTYLWEGRLHRILSLCLSTCKTSVEFRAPHSRRKMARADNEILDRFCRFFLMGLGSAKTPSSCANIFHRFWLNLRHEPSRNTRLGAAIKNHIVEIWAVAYITGKLNSPRNLSLIATPPISLGWNEALVTTNRASRKKDGCPSTEAVSVLYETALFNQLSIWRPCGYGGRHPDFVFDRLSNFDLLKRAMKACYMS
ncbi:hypothetical protein MMC07_007830 [Pseudocyphellaria aurata]|nr:hypothetical protein [Pseudocyphellaria aurata]